MEAPFIYIRTGDVELESGHARAAVEHPRKLDEFVSYDALGLAGLIRKGELSQAEVVDGSSARGVQTAGR